MARKKSLGATDVIAEAETDVLKAIRLEVPAAVHRKFRIVAANKDTNMSHLARKLVEDYVAREYKEAK